MSDEKEYEYSRTLAADTGLRERFNDLVTGVEVLNDNSRKHAEWVRNSIKFLEEKIGSSAIAAIALSEAYKIDLGCRMAMLGEAIADNMPKEAAEKFYEEFEAKIGTIPPMDSIIEKCLVTAEREFNTAGEEEEPYDPTSGNKTEEYEGDERDGVQRAR